MAKDKKPSIDDLTKSLSDIKSLYKKGFGDDKDKFDLSDFSNPDNDPNIALKVYHHMNTEKKGELSALETDISNYFTEGLNALFRQFRQDEGLAEYNFKGKEDKAFELSRKLVGQMIGYSLEHYHKISGSSKEFEAAVKKLKSGKFDDDFAQQYFQMVFGGAKEAGTFDMFVQKFAKKFKKRGNFADYATDREVAELYSPIMQYATSHVAKLKDRPISYLRTHKADDKKALEATAKHLVKQLKPTEGKAELQDVLKGNMGNMLTALANGYQSGFRSKAVGKLIGDQLNYQEGSQYKHFFD